MGQWLRFHLAVENRYLLESRHLPVIVVKIRTSDASEGVPLRTCGRKAREHNRPPLACIRCRKSQSANFSLTTDYSDTIKKLWKSSHLTASEETL